MSRCCLWEDLLFGWKFSWIAVTRKLYSRSVCATRARMPLAASLSWLSRSSKVTMAVGDWLRSSLVRRNLPPAFQTQPSGAATAARTSAWKSHLSAGMCVGATLSSASCTVPLYTSQSSPSWAKPALQGQDPEAAHGSTLSSVPSCGLVTRFHFISFPSSWCVRKLPSGNFSVRKRRPAWSMSVVSTFRILDRVIWANRLEYLFFSIASSKACCCARRVSSFFFARRMTIVISARKSALMATSATVPSPFADMPLPSSSLSAWATTLRCRCGAVTKFTRSVPVFARMSPLPFVRGTATWTPKGIGGPPQTKM
mmetsp:Transcript_7171/g.22424  ORF Transcript_7171/g.22424 Transcript_7171/m.22424 type:complete len:312 (-) Transcript_7171:485-1420(-)